MQGNGFVIRDFQLSDARPLAEIEFDPEVKQFLALPDKSMREWIEGIERLGIGGWTIQLEGGSVAGSASLSSAKRKGDCELRIVIGKQFCGRSLGGRVAKLLVQFAFEVMAAKTIVAVVHPENHASLRLVRSLGFRRRAVLQAPAPSWQVGHYIYRLTKKGYNAALV